MYLFLLVHAWCVKWPLDECASEHAAEVIKPRATATGRDRGTVEENPLASAPDLKRMGDSVCLHKSYIREHYH